MLRLYFVSGRKGGFLYLMLNAKLLILKIFLM